MPDTRPEREPGRNAPVPFGQPAMSETAGRPVTDRMVRSPRRLVLAALGVICVGLAALGLVVPGLPTTVFLIAASYLFTRSCPWLEERLVRHRMFRAYAAYLDGSCPMPRRARWTALLVMWAAVTGSLALLAARGVLVAWLAGTIVAAALAGSAFIMMYRRRVLEREWAPGQRSSAALPMRAPPGSSSENR